MSKGRARNPNIFLSSDGSSIVDQNGTPMSGVASYTWAQFTDSGFDLTIARHVHISDSHSSPSGYGGSLWYVDPLGTANNKRLLQSLPVCYATRSVAPSAASFNGLKIRDLSVGPNGAEYISNGTEYVLLAESVIYSSGVASSAGVAPAATFTAVTPSSAAAGADTLLTSAGVHGLTAAIGGTGYLYISAGTNWTVGFHKITAIAVDTVGTTIQIDTPYDASFGTPTISLANGVEMLFASITVPPLGLTSYISIDPTWGFTSSTNAKNPTVRLGGTAFFNPSVAVAAVIERPAPIIIQNAGATNVQTSANAAASSTQTGTTATSVVAGAIQTNIATTLQILGKPAVANELMWLARAIVKIGN